MRVVVNMGRCEANGLCMGIAPEVFQLDDDDELELLQEHPDDAMRESVEAAARQCPRQAITIEEG